MLDVAAGDWIQPCEITSLSDADRQAGIMNSVSQNWTLLPMHLRSTLRMRELNHLYGPLLASAWTSPFK